MRAALRRAAEAIEDGRRALELARQIGIGGLEATALSCLSLAVWHDGDREGALRLARQALQISEEFAGALEEAFGLDDAEKVTARLVAAPEHGDRSR